MDFELFNDPAVVLNSTLLREIPSTSSRKITRLYQSGDFLIFYRINQGKTEATENQMEVPVSCAPWLIDCIENKFWLPPSQGGLAKDKHSLSDIFEGEKITISRSMNAGTPGKPGFTIVNSSRKSHLVRSLRQEHQITDDQTSGYLLPALKGIRLF